MSTYIIDFSEPLKSGFQIAPGAYNGPGGPNASSSLRLYGRGALEWGEAVNEDLLRLAETFSSASPPSTPINGQLWIERGLYYHDSSQVPTNGWYFYDVNETAANKWKPVRETGIVDDEPEALPVSGQYYVDDSVTPFVLYGYYSLGKYEPLAYVRRSYIQGTGAPTALVKPSQHLRVYDDTAPETDPAFRWKSPPTSEVSAATPSSPQLGMLWLNPDTERLHVYTGTQWQTLVGPGKGSIIGGQPAVESNNDVSFQDAYYVTHLAHTTSSMNFTNGSTITTNSPTDANQGHYAVNKFFVEDTLRQVDWFIRKDNQPSQTMNVSGANGLIINRTGGATANNTLSFQLGGADTIYTGHAGSSKYAIGATSDISSASWLSVTATQIQGSGTLVLAGASSVTLPAITIAQGGITLSNDNSVINVGATSSFGNYVRINSGAVPSGSTVLSVGGQTNQNNNKIINLADGTNANDATNVTQMTAAINTAATNIYANTAVVTGSGAYKAGDIRIAAGKIYIAAAAGTGLPPGGNWRQVYPAVLG